MIVCEFSDPAAKFMNHSTRELREVLETFGYQVYRLDLHSHSLSPEPRRESYDYDNLICAKAPPLCLA